jgi:curved DNA-binding protein
VRDYGYDQKYAGEDFEYTQEDIFRDIFSNPFAREVFRDLSQDFSRYGIRFDKRFFDQVFFGGKGVIFGGVFFIGPGRFNRGFNKFGNRYKFTPEKKPVPQNTFLSKLGGKIGKFILRKIFDFPKEDKGEDLYYSLSITPQEAFSGTEKRIALKRGIKTEKLLVKVPPGINSGTNLRLKGKGKKGSPGGPAGDLYLKIRIQ